MKLLLLGMGLVAAGLFLGHSEIFNVVYASGLFVLAIGIPRFIWLNAGAIARIAGKIAARGATHVETFKEAFKDERNK